MKPSNGILDGAIAAWVDMRLSDIRSQDEVDTNSQWKLFLKDIANFEGLLEKLTKKHEATALMREALFGVSGVLLNAKSKKESR